MNSIKRIWVVGGGTAGAMTAVTLKKYFPKIDIRILEGRNIPTVGVGESTLGQINHWLAMVDIKDEEWMKECNASYKLSIRFENFHKLNDGGFHYPFGDPYTLNNIAGLNDWHFKKIIFPKTHNSDYANCLYPIMALVNQNKLFKNEKKYLPCFDFKRHTAYHFDASKFGEWLKEKYFKKLGGRVLVENIVSVEKNEDGSIKYLHLDTENKIEGKDTLFVDCTGFQSLLLGKSLNVPFESYEHMLPNNSAWATHINYTDKEKELKPYTNCTAIENGWVWNIPLWSRMGSGYVYSDKYISDEDALKQYKNYLMKTHNFSKKFVEEDMSYKKLKMRIGLHKKLWVKNVVAIGLSAGFIEPLESNGLFTVHEFLFRLVRMLQRETITEFTRQNYNFACRKIFREFAEFVSLHYALSERTDTEYWRDITKKEWPVSETNKRWIDGFDTAIWNKMFDYHYPDLGGLQHIAAGMDWNSTDLPSIKYGLMESDLDKIKKLYKNPIDTLNKRKTAWDLVASKQPSLYEFLKKEIYNV